MLSKQLNLRLSRGEKNICSFIEKEILKFGSPIRWYISSTKPNEEYIEISVEAIIDDSIINPEKNIESPPKFESKNSHSKKQPVFMHIVPTGVQAAVGGSLGDAMPVNIFLSNIGTLLTHPNTCNGGPLLIADRNSLQYVEGNSLNELMRGNISLRPANYEQKIGVIIDSGVNDKWTMDRAYNAVNGFYAHTGVNIIGILETADSVGSTIHQNTAGAFTGKVENLNTIFEAAEKLIAKGANRLAIFTYVAVEDRYWTGYFNGNLPNPVGGVEAIISHSVSKKFGILSAHGPLVKQEEEIFIESAGRVSPEMALEAASPFYLWCVLRGLQESPAIELRHSASANSISREDISVIICPAGTLGGIPMLKAEEYGIPILAIKQNTTVLNVSAESLGLKNTIELDSYVEAAGLLAIAKEQNDFSLQSLINIMEQNDIYKIGKEFLSQLGINPNAVLRPSKMVPRL